MIDTSAIYRNPVVPPRLYYMKVTSVKAEEANYLFPKLLITLVAHPAYKLPKDYVFASIIHPTQKAYWHYKHFFDTFLPEQNPDDLQKAVGVWGGVKLEECKYGKTVYSAVKFIWQPLAIKLKAQKIGEAEQKKGIDLGSKAC